MLCDRTGRGRVRHPRKEEDRRAPMISTNKDEIFQTVREALGILIALVFFICLGDYIQRHILSTQKAVNEQQQLYPNTMSIDEEMTLRHENAKHEGNWGTCDKCAISTIYD